VNKKIFAGITAALVLAVGIYIYYGVQASAETSMSWVTVDAAELETVRESVAQKGGILPYSVVENKGGIVILHMNDEYLGTLSKQMHEEFHKCAGFSSHATYEEAAKFAEQSLNVDPNAQDLVYTLDNANSVNALVPETSESYTRSVIETLSAFHTRRYNQPTGLQSAAWIKDTWTALGADRPDISVAYFNHPTTVSPQPSVILTITGKTTPNEIVVLGAHQDSINLNGQTQPAPGADDDASGIACLTDMIRVLASSGFQPDRTVQFMAYAAEEAGLRGSNDIATNYSNQGKNVIGVLQLDMTNYRDPASVYDMVLITDRTNASQNQFVRDILSTYLPTYNVGSTVCNYGCSDHSSWTNNGYASSFPFEAPFNPPPSYDNPYIHSSEDTLDKSGGNATMADKFTKLGLAYVAELAKGSIATTVSGPAKFDYDGDGRSDVSVYRPSEGIWYINASGYGFYGFPFGLPTDVITPGDFDGDQKTDAAIFRDGIWHMLRSTQGYGTISLGAVGDIPQPGDFDGDGTDDPAVFRPSSGTWYINGSSSGYSTVSFGGAGDRPVSADFDGDGKIDPALYRDGQWHILGSQNGYSVMTFGVASDTPVPGDFDGDGKTDIAVYRGGYWFIYNSGTGTVSIFQFGLPTDVPTVGDFDGDGRADAAIYRNGEWWVRYTASGSFYAEVFGVSTDIPTESAFNQ
jgi:leucyl aminopeptidase